MRRIFSNISLKDIKEEIPPGLIKFQRYFRNLFIETQKTNKMILEIDNLFQRMTHHIEHLFLEHLITKETYEKNITELNNIYNSFKELPIAPLRMRLYNKLDKTILKDTFGWIYENIRKLFNNVGAPFLSDILDLEIGNGYLESNMLEYLHFIEKCFVPFKAKWVNGEIPEIIPNNLKQSLSDSLNLGKSPLKYSSDSEQELFNFKDIDNNIIRSKTDDDLKPNTNTSILKNLTNPTYNQNELSIIMDLANIKGESLEIPFCSKIYPPESKSLLERVEGVFLFIPWNKRILKIHGYFKIDHLNQVKNHNLWWKKWNDLQDCLPYISAPEKFKTEYLKQISLRDFVSLSVKELAIKIRNQWEELCRIKNKPLNLLVKEFVNHIIEIQRNIIKLLLLDDNEESNLLAHVLYDLIVNQSELLKSVDHSEQIYRSFHWSLKHKLNIVFKNSQKILDKLKNITDNDINYEKRIALLKAPQKVKQKALDRLKEMNGSRESSTKAQQYLDGLLKIPFGTYHKEWIISFLDDFKQNLKTTMIILFKKKEDISDISTYNFLLELENFWNKSTIDTEIEITKCMTYIEEAYQKYLNILEELDIDSPIIEDIDIEIENNNLNDNTLIKDINPLDINQQNNIYEKDSSSSEGSENYEYIKRKCKLKMLRIEKIKTALLDNNVQNKDTLLRLSNELNEVESLLKSYYRGEVVIKNDVAKELKELVDLINDWKDYCRKREEYLIEVRATLDKCVHGQDKTKKQIESLIAQWINGKSGGAVIGLHGPPGCAKTTIIREGIAKCLKDKDGKSRPFAFISLGGQTYGSFLLGHNYTYISSSWGRIVDSLIECKSLSCIIQLDELDKVGQGPHGQEIIAALTHMTDPSQNKDWSDTYFSGIPIDLSNVIFVFTYNDRNLIDRILLDRITEIKVDSLNDSEKITITKDYMLPEILDKTGYKAGDIIIKPETIKYIIESYTIESGVRKLKEKIYEIIREVNRRKVMNDSKYKFPLIIENDIVDDILENNKITPDRIHNEPMIGVINGLYASQMNYGGLVPIECCKSYFNSKSSLQLTGSQGETMKETAHVARERAMALMTTEERKTLMKEWKDEGEWGILLHTPDAGTKKDGPSASGAYCIAIYSLLTGKKIRNDVAMTGELRVSGSINKIGGLDMKIRGGIRAGVKKILFPKDNLDDYEKYFEKCKKHNEEIPIELIAVDSIEECLKHFIIDPSENQDQKEKEE